MCVYNQQFMWMSAKMGNLAQMQRRPWTNKTWWDRSMTGKKQNIGNPFLIDMLSYDGYNIPMSWWLITPWIDSHNQVLTNTWCGIQQPKKSHAPAKVRMQPCDLNQQRDLSTMNPTTMGFKQPGELTIQQPPESRNHGRGPTHDTIWRVFNIM